MENLGQRKQYQSSINQLKKRKSELKKQYGQIQAKTQIVEDRIDTLRKIVRELREENVNLSQKIERKVYKHKNTLVREKNLKRDIENLEMSQVTLQSRYNQKAQEILELERKLSNLEAKKSTLMQKNSERSKAQLGMNKRKESIEKKLLTLDEELKFYEARLNKTAIDPMVTELKKN
jgi:chromosome segregation ATPase